MKIHHLNCATMCPASAARVGEMVCHCLLIEARDALILVETGLGTDDIANPARLGRLFHAAARPRLDLSETAVHQIRGLGHDPADVRHVVVTHLDVDHAGGLPDFPDAQVHVSVEEHTSAQHPELRYIAAQWAHGPRWVLHQVAGEQWFGFDAVRAVPGTDAEVLLIPLPGHSAGHCGVAVQGPDGWLLHAGDAFFHRHELQGRRPPVGLWLFQRFVDHDHAARVRNQHRLAELHRDHGDEVRILCAHDPAMLARARR